MANSNFSIKMDYTPEIKAALKAKGLKIMEMWGQLAEGYAKENLTASGAVDTGNLRNSVTFTKGQEGEAEFYMGVGTDVNYGIYVEMGTGKYVAGGRQTPWSYQDSEGKWHRTSGMKARPFIKPAIAKNKDTYKQVAIDELTS